jgi:hypothetical protein
MHKASFWSCSTDATPQTVEQQNTQIDKLLKLKTDSPAIKLRMTIHVMLK